MIPPNLKRESVNDFASLLNLAFTGYNRVKIVHDKCNRIFTNLFPSQTSRVRFQRQIIIYGSVKMKRYPDNEIVNVKKEYWVK